MRFGLWPFRLLEYFTNCIAYVMYIWGSEWAVHCSSNFLVEWGQILLPPSFGNENEDRPYFARKMSFEFVKIVSLPVQLHMPSQLPSKNPTSERKHSHSISDLSDSSTPHSFEDFRKNSILYTNVIAFTLYELETITKSFRSDYILGEGGFGTVYKGYIDENVRVGLKSLPVAVKVLNKEGLQGHREWLVIARPTHFVARFIFLFILMIEFFWTNMIPGSCNWLDLQTEVNFLGQPRHPNLVKLIGYFCEEDHRLLVYEFMFRGSFEHHLLRSVHISFLRISSFPPSSTLFPFLLFFF